jgi:hypothetical protein
MYLKHSHLLSGNSEMESRKEVRKMLDDRPLPTRVFKELNIQVGGRIVLQNLAGHGNVRKTPGQPVRYGGFEPHSSRWGESPIDSGS